MRDSAMGKRSNFERREADFYPTPRAAVLPSDPVPARYGHQDLCRTCAGEGDLVRHALESFGLACAYQGDIRTGQDALGINHYGAADAIITNPPYTRDLMHRLIEHFQRIAPTWLLLETDWVSTLQAVPYLPHCPDIVTIGRLKWIEGSKHTGKDNHAWFRFDASHRGATAIHRRNQGGEIARPRRAGPIFPGAPETAFGTTRMKAALEGQFNHHNRRRSMVDPNCAEL